VTSTLVFEGEGRIGEYVGGYDDWLRQRPAPAAVTGRHAIRPATPVSGSPAPGASSASGGAASPSEAPPRRLSYKEQRELDGLPDRIAELEAEQAALQTRVNDPAFYKEPPEAIAAALARVAALDGELLTAMARWDELDSRRGRTG